MGRMGPRLPHHNGERHLNETEYPLKKRLEAMSEEEKEFERHIDDDYNVISHFYSAKTKHPNIPFYLRDEMGNTCEFGWSLIYQYIENCNQ